MVVTLFTAVSQTETTAEESVHSTPLGTVLVCQGGQHGGQHSAQLPVVAVRTCSSCGLATWPVACARRSTALVSVLSSPGTLRTCRRACPVWVKLGIAQNVHERTPTGDAFSSVGPVPNEWRLGHIHKVKCPLSLTACSTDGVTPHATCCMRAFESQHEISNPCYAGMNKHIVLAHNQDP